jgi:murein DD-endopeptidase MepM/ murein hydrolase activator NlpD
MKAAPLPRESDPGQSNQKIPLSRNLGLPFGLNVVDSAEREGTSSASSVPARALRVRVKARSRFNLQRLRLILISLLLAGLGSLGVQAALHERRAAEERLAHQCRLAVRDVKALAARRDVSHRLVLPPRTTFAQFLRNGGVAPGTVGELIRDARPVYDLSSVRAGNQVTWVTSGSGMLRSVSYQIDPDHTLSITRVREGFHARIQDVPYVVTVTGVSGTVQDSLFQAVTDQGESDQLALDIADIFGWDIDFNTETRRGDRFAVVVEKKTLEGRFAGYGRMLAAEYDNAGRQYQAVLFHDSAGRPAYYRPDGKSLQKAFLRSPLRFAARITSHFSYHRYHPILHRYMPHLGIDYGAPVGSAVQAVADGTVVVAGWHGGGGKEVCLRHAKGYKTYYLHLSRLLVHAGQHVSQGQVIARTGETGLATGPHLDFRIALHGRFLNFLNMHLPPAKAVARNDWDDFVAARTQEMNELASLRSYPTAASEQASLDTAGEGPGGGK